MTKKTKVLITILILVTISIDCLKYNEICFKNIQFDGKYFSLSNCTGLLTYDCDKFKCALNADACNDYDSLWNELTEKKNSKLDRAFTEGLMKGISFASKRLKKFEYLTKRVKICIHN